MEVEDLENSTSEQSECINHRMTEEQNSEKRTTVSVNSQHSSNNNVSSASLLNQGEQRDCKNSIHFGLRKGARGKPDGIHRCGLDVKCAFVYWSRFNDRAVHVSGHFPKLKCRSGSESWGCGKLKIFSLMNYTHVRTHDSGMEKWICPKTLLCPYCEDRILMENSISHLLSQHHAKLRRRKEREDPLREYVRTRTERYSSRQPKRRNMHPLPRGPMLEEAKSWYPAVS